jgi:hypothetical protein
MLRFKRPRRPKGFAKAASAAARAVTSAIAAGQRPEFPELWAGFKDLFVVAQHDKCGYCETFSLNHPCAMDHIAPKGNVHILVKDGVEADSLYNVRDRETREISRTGYYWLAYDWNNWLLVCERCNTGWKRTLFPVREVPYPCPPRPRRRYTPLLLNPFGPEDPVDHLEFDSIGVIFPREGSALGDATIQTCGLHRESLRRARQGIAADTHRYIGRLQKALDGNDLQTARNAAEDLLSIGSEERAHAGMVRSMVRTELKLRWRELMSLGGRLDALAPRRLS